MKAIGVVAGKSPSLVIDLFDRYGPIDVSNGSTNVLFIVENGPTLTCEKLTGYDDGSGIIDVSGPYATPGAGGRVQANVSPTTFPTAGQYRAEITIDQGPVDNTVYDVVIVNARQSLDT